MWLSFVPLLSVSRPSNFSDYIKSNFCMLSEVSVVWDFVCAFFHLNNVDFRPSYLFIWLQQASRIEI